MCGCVCVCAHTCAYVFHRLAPLHAEKADISRGSVIERILLPASHCHGGWRECWIVGRDAKGEIGERAEDENIHCLLADTNEILSV